ncbi:MAG: [protein-PII] uridylyltransferase [Verrucomicrobiales bacterium]|nr:[protein-PII] uridylyltransferase [Verrucomicrobiales bacterium]MBP9224244.1 [protein-PII] uridylyltransferase [Verrucomicrobiales bacterium]
MSLPSSLDPARESAIEILETIKSASGEKRTMLTLYKEYLKTGRKGIRESHSAGGSGLVIASRLSALMDVLLSDLLRHFLKETDAIAKTGQMHPVTIVASGGYGRGQLNPGSDIDLQFLTPGSTSRLPLVVKELVNRVSLMLFDLGLNVSYPVRSIKEACAFANKDHQTKTTLLDARFICGDESLFTKFEETFFDLCLRGHEKSYLAERSRDIRSRHQKHGNTPHLQEPNVKEGCGALRDHHNLVWVLWVLRKSRDISALVAENKVTEDSFANIEAAFEFLMRVRNELHYCQKGRPGDILSLRLQGVVATKLNVPGTNILRKSETFMRDYYRHTRNLYQQSTSLMQSFELEVVNDDTRRTPVFNFLARQTATEDSFDGFQTRRSLIYPENDSIFEEDPNRLMRYFLHSQRRNLQSSPEIRELISRNLHLVDDTFRKSRANRATFEEILQNRGQVAHIFRKMHQLGFLGLYLPEFGQLTDLVQHEFFHRYSADEHTLRCIEILDSLIHSEDPKKQFFRRIFQNMEDPVAMYVALLLHDTGRAENVRHHEDASALLAAQVCQRLDYRGDRLRLIMFLVDHHLTFWKTSTTMDITDLETITEFAAATKNRKWMEALHLFTYVDSNGTNDTAWNDWKESLMSQLHRRTAAFFEDRNTYRKEFTRPVTETKSKVLAKLPEGLVEEVEAHFAAMPRRYFRHRGSTSIVRHINLFHRFFERTAKSTNESLIPVLGWETRSDEGYSLLEVAGWNRHHLLAKVAGALAARNLNILSADFYVRADDLVLDIFRICTATFNPVTSPREIERIENLIHQEFSVDEKEVKFRSLIEDRVRPSITQEEPPNFDIPQRIYFSNEENETSTMLEIQAQDRIGLLYDIFTILGNHDAEVLNARISTQAGAAIDRFFLVDSSTELKITDKNRLTRMQDELQKCILVTRIESDLR